VRNKGGSVSELDRLRGENEELRWRLKAVTDEYELAEQDIVRLRRRCSYLEQKAKQRDQADPGKDVQDIFDYWVVACRKDPKRTKLTAQRRDAIRKALREGYDAYDIQRAIMGLARGAFVKDGVRYDDITVACRKVEMYRDKADAIEAFDQEQKGAVAQEARKFLIEKCGRHYSKPDLPALWSGGFEYFAHLLKLKGCQIKDGYGNKLTAQCPAHDDRHPSLSVIEADDGRVLAKCHSNQCSWEDICRALGVDGRVFGPRDHHTYGKPTDNGQQISFEAAA
jgi:hypothetical protein